MKKILISTIFVLLFLCNFKGIFNTYADGTYSSLSISPSLNEVTIDKNSDYNTFITIKNNTVTPIPIKVFAQDFGVKNDNGDITYFTLSDNKDDPSRWFIFSTSIYALGPYESINVPITIATPSNATSGGYYVSVFFEQINTSMTGNSLNIVPRIGALFFLTIPGNNIIHASVVQNNITANSTLTLPVVQKQIITGNNIDFNVLISNTGNTHVDTYGNLTIYNMLNQKVDVLEIPQHIILPNTQRAVEISWKAPTQLIGKYKVITDIYNVTNAKSMSSLTNSFNAYTAIEPTLIILLTIILIVFILVYSKRRVYDLLGLIHHRFTIAIKAFIKK